MFLHGIGYLGAEMAELPSADNTGSERCACFMTGCWHSIRTHLIILLTMVVTIVYGVVAFVDIARGLSKASHDLHDQVKLLTDVQAEALSVPLWDLNVEEVTRQLNVLVVNRDIVEAEVIETEGGIFANASAQGAIDTYPAGAHHHDHDRHGLTNREPSTLDFMLGRHSQGLHLITSDIRNEHRDIIGTLRVIVTHEHLADVQESMFWAHLRKFLVITIVIGVTIGMAVTSLVRPVLGITEAMGKVAAGELNTAIPATGRRDEIGKMARALEVFKANAEQLQETLDKERELAGLQRQFVSMVSHEFRTPLAVIDGSAQRILRRLGRISEDGLSKGLTKIRHSVVRLTELMESVLNAARLEGGRIAFEPDACCLPDILTELASSYGDLYADREFTLGVDDLPGDMVADSKLLRQVFSNLLSNACKYSDAGARIRIEGRWDRAGAITISISDEGIGIPPDELEKLFDRFFRASTSTGIAGTGIGLHLVQHFVDLHHGHVEVTSIVGKGTTFTVHLPYEKAGSVTVEEAA